MIVRDCGSDVPIAPAQRRRINDLIEATAGHWRSLFELGGYDRTFGIVAEQDDGSALVASPLVEVAEHVVQSPAREREEDSGWVAMMQMVKKALAGPRAGRYPIVVLGRGFAACVSIDFGDGGAS